MQRSRLGEERRSDMDKGIEEFRSDDEEDSQYIDKQSIPIGSANQAL